MPEMTQGVFDFKKPCFVSTARFCGFAKQNRPASSLCAQRPCLALGVCQDKQNRVSSAPRVFAVSREADGDFLVVYLEDRKARWKSSTRGLRNRKRRGEPSSRRTCQNSILQLGSCVFNHSMSSSPSLLSFKCRSHRSVRFARGLISLI